jgi:iron(III) transport system permease protein
VLVAFGWLGAALGVARMAGGRELYQLLMGSGLLLALAYGARFLAEVHGPLKTAVLRLDPRHEEAVAVLGAPRSAWMGRVALPALWPGVRTAFLLGVVVLAKELPITLLLGTPAGLQPLAFRLWDRYAEALWHDAGLAGLLLIAVGAVAQLLLRTTTDTRGGSDPIGEGR